MAIKRETAIKCKILDVVNGRYIKREGWEANYLETALGRISRINIIGVVINNENKGLIIDDGSASIQLRDFEGKGFPHINTGVLVLVVGRPREFNEQKFIFPEIVKQIQNPKWAQLRLLELKNVKRISPENIIQEEKPVQNIETVQEEKEKIMPSNKETENKKILSLAEQIINKIIKLDSGSGVRIDDILKQIDSNLTNNTITQLIEEGEIFEIKPGIVKSL